MATAKQSKADVSTPGILYAERESHWQVVEDLLGGTLTMRECGRTYLPQWTGESDDAYEARLASAVLFPALEEAIDGAVARPFSRALTIAEEEKLADERLKRLRKSPSRGPGDLDQFARAAFRDMVERSMTWVLVDYPQTTGEETLADERALDVRPYFVHLPADSVIGWRWGVDDRGAATRELDEIRIEEASVERLHPDDPEDWSEGYVRRIRVIERQQWRLYEKSETKKGPVWTLVEEGPNTLGRVPVVLIECDPEAQRFTVPFEELAWVNAAHWRNSADQEHVVAVMRTPTWFATGIAEDEPKGGLTIGPTAFVRLGSPDATFGLVEHSGAGVAAGREHIRALEAYMQVLSMRPFLEKSVQTTATETGLDEVRTQSEIQSWVRSLERGLEQAFAFAAEWIGQELPEGFAVDIHSDFAVAAAAAEDMRNLLAAWQAGAISHETLLREMKRRRVLAEEIDVAEELERVEQESPSLLDLPTPPQPPGAPAQGQTGQPPTMPFQTQAQQGMAA